MAGTDLRGGPANGRRARMIMNMLDNRLMADRSCLNLADRPEVESLPSGIFRHARISLQPALTHIVLIPSEVVAEFVQEGGAHFIAEVLLILFHPLPEILQK